MKKRVLSMLMALALCLTLLPTAALAEENTTEPSTQLTEPTPVPQEPKTPDQGENTETPDQPEEPSQDEPPAADEPPAVQSEPAPQAAEAAEAAVAEVDGVNYDDIQKAFDAVKQSNGGTLTLLANCKTLNTSKPFDISGNYTLDLNGCTLTGRLYLSETSTSLTVMDSSTGGKIQATGSWSPLWVYGGDVTIESGTLATQNENAQALVFGDNDACKTLTITGGSFETGYVNIGASGGKTVISGGAFHELRVNGDSKRVTLSGGTFDTVKRRKSGSTIAPADLLADGYTFVNRETGAEVSTSQEAALTNVQVVSKETANASASLTVDGTETPYGTFEDALTAAQQTPGGTLTLLNNVNLVTQVYVNSGTFTLDLNGHTLTSGDYNTLVVGDGSVTIQDSKVGGVISNTRSDGIAVYCYGGNVTILSGSITSKLFWESGTVSLQGGAFRSLNRTDGSWLSAIPEGKALERNGQITDASKKELITEDGFYVLADHEKHDWQAGKCACGREHTDHKWKDGECIVCHLTCSHGTIGGDGVCTTCGTQFAVRDDDGNYYKHLADALAIESVDDVTLVADDTLSEDVTLIKDIFFYPNGHTVSGGGAIVVPRGKRLVLGEKDETEKAGNAGAILVEDGGTLMVDEGFTGTVQTLTVSETADVKLSGGTYRTITGSRQKAGTLLYNDNNHALAFQKQDGSFARYDQRISSETPLKNVTVAFCRHEQLTEACDGACEYCNGALGARIGSQGYWNLNTEGNGAVDNVKNGETIVLLKNSDPKFGSFLKSACAYTIDLNGHSTIKGWTVSAGTPKIVDSKGGGKISQLEIDSKLGLTLADLLPKGWDFQKSDGNWLSTTELKGKTASNVTVAQLPIQSMKYPTEMSMTYGGTGTLIVNVKGTGAVTFQWYKVGDGNEKAVGSETTKNQFDFSALKLPAGKHIFRFSATCNGYKKMSQDIVVTVQKADIRSGLITPPTAQENLTYTGQEQELITAGSVTSGGTMQYSLTENGTYSQDTPTGTDAGAYTVWYRVIGDANHNDTAPASVAVSIGKKPLTITGVTAVSKPYDGTTNAGIPSVTFDGVTLNRGTDYTVTANFDDAGVDSGKNITATVTLMGQAAKNYALEQSSFTTTGNITKAAAPDFTKETTLTIVNDCEKTYTVTLPALPTLETPKEYGALTYEIGEIKLNDGYCTGGAKVENGKLTLPIQKNDVETTGSVGTVTVVIKSTNYEDITLTVKVNAANKIEPTPDGEITATPITYGDTLSNSKISGKMKDPNTGDAVNGTFTWTDGTIKPDANDRYEADWTFTPAAGYEKYATATGTVTIKVKPAKLTVSVKASRMYYTGEAQIASIIASGQSVDSTPVTFTYSDNVDGNYTSGGPTFTDAGTYTVYYKAEAANHEPATGTFTVTIDPLPISLLSVSSISKTYDGSADVTLTADKLTFFSKTAKATNIKLPDTVLSFSNAQFTKQQADGSYLPSPEVGGGKALSFTMMLTSNNYVFEGKSGGTTEVSDVFATDDANRFTITKAAAPTAAPGSLTITNGLHKTYSLDFSALLPKLTAPCDYGTITYGKPNTDLGVGGYKTFVDSRSGKLTLEVVERNSDVEGQFGTITVTISTGNYQDITLTVNIFAKNKITPVLDGEVTASEITYGQTLSDSSITGKMKDPTTGKSVNGTFAWKDGTINPNAGDYEAEWTFTPAAGYEKYATATGTVTIKVNKATPTFTAPTAQENLTYTGQEQALITAGSVTSGGTMQYSLTENGTYSQDSPTGTDAGAYTVWYRVIGDENHNDTTPASVAVRIGQKPLTITGVTAASKPYDGTTNADISSVTFDNVTLNRGTDYTVTANFDDAGVDSGKNITATVTLMGQTAKNYVLEQSSLPTTGSITKAAAPDFTKETALTIVNGHEKTYTVTLPALPTLETPKAYGALTYEIGEIKLNDGYYTSGAKVENGELTLPIQKNDVETTGSVGTVTVVIKSANYEDITLTVNVSAKNKLSPVLAGTLTLTPIKITYGEPLSKIKITGTMKVGDTVVEGTFSWQQPGDTILDASTSGHDVGWTFTPKDGNTYTEVTGTVKVPVAPKSIEGAAITLEKYEFQYNAAEQSPRITGVTLEDWSETRITYDIKSGDKATDANDSIPLTIEGTGNYTGTAMVEWKITPKTVTPTIKVASCTYTGDALKPTVTVKDDIGNIIDQKEYEIFYSNNTNAGTATVTIKDADGGNYVLSEASKTFEITKAAAPTAAAGSLTITNGLHKTYSLDLSTLLPKLTAPCDYGTIAYDKKVDTTLGSGTFVTLVNGKTGELTLEANRSATDEGQFGAITVTISTSNYQDITLTIHVSAKNRITPTGTPTLSKNAITYGNALNTIALSGKLHDNVNNVDVDGTFEWVDGTHIPVVGNGTYAAEWIFEPTDTEKYLTVSGRSNITVEKAQQYGKVSMAGYTYGQAPSTPTLTDRTGDANAQVTYSYAAAGNGSVQTWDIQNPPALNAGTYRMYASIGDTDNYYGFEAVHCEFVVAKATPTYTKPTDLTAKYGQTLADVTLPDGWSWTDSSESVGGASTAAKTFQAKFTPKDTENYNTVENIGLEVMVNKADGGSLKTVELEQKYTDASDHTYTPDWSEIPTGQTWSYNSEYSVSNGSKATLTKQDFAADGSLLTYAISGGKAGDKITITLKSSCNNYEDFTITLTITLTEKDDQQALRITGGTTVVYGQTLQLGTTGGSGTGAVTYAVTNGTGEATIDATGKLTPVKVGTVKVKVTKAADASFNEATSTEVEITITRATPTGAPKYTAITTSGKTLADAGLTVTGSTLNPNAGTLVWVDNAGNVLPGTTAVAANTTYKWLFTPTDANYTTLTGSIELYHKSSSSGGWYYTYYTIKATAGTNGSISPSGWTSVRDGWDQTFTITPDKGYAVAKVLVDGKSVGAVKSYTFKNVTKDHTIEAIFMKSNGNPQTGVFVDVAEGSYYEEAIDWAVEKGVTNGVSSNMFAPNDPCTRAQIVTFLWRAAGSPAPKSMSSFTDVPADAFYAKAVAWAVENGITSGTGEGKFSPNSTCTRAQAVTFLYRASGSPAVSGSAEFSDVATNAYYADAVAWAAKKGITTGIGGGLFGSDNDCTRGQIVTFLWRAMAE